jgi:hypothetical protein
MLPPADEKMKSHIVSSVAGQYITTPGNELEHETSLDVQTHSHMTHSCRILQR